MEPHAFKDALDLVEVVMIVGIATIFVGLVAFLGLIEWSDARAPEHLLKASSVLTVAKPRGAHTAP